MTENQSLEAIRLFEDGTGVTRFETVTVPLVSNLRAVDTIEYPAGKKALAPPPFRHLLILTRGALQVTLSSGETQLLEAGDALLLENLIGTGHALEVVSEKAVKAIRMKLA